MVQKRAIILLMDSFGIGTCEDSAKYGDEGANTFGHILEKFPNTKIPNLTNLGLINCLEHSCNNTFGHIPNKNPTAQYGYAQEISHGKDTPSGHWELMGFPVLFDWGYFHAKTNSFPQELLDVIYKKANLTGSLGNCIGSGTNIIDTYAREHLETKKPIFYTSADSVFQIACHEEIFGLENLYHLCKIAREELYKYNIGRVIARPFIGNLTDGFKRTGNRKDYSIAPQEKTLLDVMKEQGGSVVSIGKISDIFAGSGITKAVKSSTLPNLWNDTLGAVQTHNEYSIIFTNFVDFDSEYGHRRDVKGYKEALEYFDSRLPEILKLLTDDDLLIITADHGCDPTWVGTDHTREYIPILFYNKKIQAKYIGKRPTFSDVGQSIASFLGLPALKNGKSFLQE
jgi:phosphopentomutase